MNKKLKNLQKFKYDMMLLYMHKIYNNTKLIYIYILIQFWVVFYFNDNLHLICVQFSLNKNLNII